MPIRLALSLTQISAAAALEVAKKAVTHGHDPKLFILEWQQIPPLDAMRPREADAITELA